MGILKQYIATHVAYMKEISRVCSVATKCIHYFAGEGLDSFTRETACIAVLYCCTSSLSYGYSSNTTAFPACTNPVPLEVVRQTETLVGVNKGF